MEPESVSSVQVILVATADSAEGMQQSIRRCFRHEVNMKAINEDQRKNLISETLHGVSTVADEVFFVVVIEPEMKFYAFIKVSCLYGFIFRVSMTSL